MPGILTPRTAEQYEPPWSFGSGEVMVPAFFLLSIAVLSSAAGAPRRSACSETHRSSQFSQERRHGERELEPPGRGKIGCLCEERGQNDNPREAVPE